MNSYILNHFFDFIVYISWINGLTISQKLGVLNMVSFLSLETSKCFVSQLFKCVQSAYLIETVQKIENINICLLFQTFLVDTRI